MNNAYNGSKPHSMVLDYIITPLGVAPKKGSNVTTETFYAIRRDNPRGEFAHLDCKGSFIYTGDVKQAHAFNSVADALVQLDKRNQIMRESCSFSAADRFTIVEVIRTTTPGERTMRLAQPGERPDAWTILVNGSYYPAAKPAAVKGMFIEGYNYDGKYNTLVTKARTFLTEQDAVRFAIGGNLVGQNIRSVKFVGIVESTTPAKTTYRVERL